MQQYINGYLKMNYGCTQIIDIYISAPSYQLNDLKQSLIRFIYVIFTVNGKKYIYIYI